MPLDKFVLLIVVTTAAAAATVFGAAYVTAAWELPRLALASAIPILLVGYVLWRVVADRLRARADDPYDRTPR
jgi:hypothetical protein